MALRGVFWAGMGAAVLAIGCTTAGAEHVKPLEQARADVQTGLATLHAWNVDSVSEARARIAERFKDLDWLTGDSLVTFRVQDADIVGDWARARRFLKDGPERLRQLAADGATCETQCAGLAAAIRQGAEVDAEGTPMDEAYFRVQVARELEVVAQWTQAVAETARLVSLGTTLEGATRPRIDSLIVAKRAEWAQQIHAQP